MHLITRQDELEDAIAEFETCDFVTVDTEFIRETTFWPVLCLIQMASPTRTTLIDPLANGIDLAPFFRLMGNEKVLKVFHAARQDIEIIFHEGGLIPHPVFDTQVAAMVCGFGEQVGYETLVRKIAHQSLDKTSRFTDWSRRPLSEAQKTYALADVTHLRQIYEFLSNKLEKTGRARWVAEELQTLLSPETYVTEPQDAWKRVKTRTNSPKFLAIVRELAAFREDYARGRNIPRNRVFKDDALTELASTKPKDMKDLSRSRLLLREARKGDIAEGILAAVQAGLDMDPDDMPQPDRTNDKLQVDPALADLLRVLLKAKADGAGVAPRLIAATSELDALSAGKRDVPALQGWRKEVFGADALKLCDGKVGLAARKGKVDIIEL